MNISVERYPFLLENRDPFYVIFPLIILYISHPLEITPSHCR